MRFYLSNSAAPVTPSTQPGSIWEAVSGTAVTQALTIEPTGTNTTVTGSEAVNSATNDVRLARFVSPPIVHAGDVSGVVSWCFARSVDDPAGAFSNYVSIWVVSGDGATVRGVAGNVTDTSAAWTSTLTARSVTVSAGLPTAVAAQVGDRIVVDLGFRSASTNTTSYTGTIRYGGTAGADLVNGDTTNALTRSGWIRFTDADALFLEPPTRAYFTSAPGATGGDPSAGSWDDSTASSTPLKLSVTPTGDPLELSRTETDASANYDAMLGTWVSPPLAADVTIPGGTSFAWAFARRSNTGAGLGLHYRLYALTSTGTVRDQAFNWTVPPGATPIFNESGTPVGIRIADSTATPMSALAGDRLVFEFGFQQVAATATAATGSMWAGGTSATDIAADDTDLNRPGWIDIPAGPVFVEPSTVTGTASAPLGALTATASGVRTTGATASASLGGLTASASATVVHAGGKIATFVDNFTTADTAKWVFNGSTVSSGQLQVPCTTAYPYAYAASSWDLTASSCSLELVQLPPSGVGTTSTYIVLEATSGNDVRFVIEDSGTLYARHTVAGTPTTMATAAYNATNHRWLRISESGGVVTWTTSPDSTTWATFATWTVSGLTLTAVFPSLTCGYWGAETSPAPAVFDNFNLASVAGTAAAPLGSLTATATGTRTIPPGTAAAPLGPLTATAVGTVTATAAAAAPLGALTATAAATRATAATAAAPLGGLAASAAGTAFTGPNAQATLGALTAAAAGTRTTGATAAAPLGALTATAAGTRTSTGATAAATLGALTATAAQAADGPEPGRFFLVY